MNNALLEIDFPEERDIKPDLRKKASELGKIIKALREVSNSQSWLVLKEQVFDTLIESIEHRILLESTSSVNVDKLHNLNGQLTMVRKYADFNKLADAYETELSSIRKKLNATD